MSDMALRGRAAAEAEKVEIELMGVKKKQVILFQWLDGSFPLRIHARCFCSLFVQSSSFFFFFSQTVVAWDVFFAG